MNRRDFQKLSTLRLREAGVLLRAELFDGAYYLTGYAIECALKACIARRTKAHDFPDRAFATACHTHKLDELLRHAGLEAALRQRKELEVYWESVKKWSEAARYEHGKSKVEAEVLYAAATKRGSGIIPWLKRHW